MLASELMKNSNNGKGMTNFDQFLNWQKSRCKNKQKMSNLTRRATSAVGVIFEVRCSRLGFEGQESWTKSD